MPKRIHRARWTFYAPVKDDNIVQEKAAFAAFFFAGNKDSGILPPHNKQAKKEFAIANSSS
jgi:hypothetical protein